MESNTYDLQNKIKSARNLFHSLKNSNLYGGDIIDDAIEAIDDIELNFQLSIVHVFMEKNDKNRALFSNIISTNGYTQQIDELVDKVNMDISQINKSKNNRSILQKHFNIYPIGDIAIQNKQVDYNICELCGDEMMPVMNKSELKCRNNSCCLVKESFVVEEIQMFNKNSAITQKAGKFTPNKHFNVGWEQLLAQESPDKLINKKAKYGTVEEVINALRFIVRRDCMLIKIITVDELRNMLIEIGRTDLNKNTSLLLKKLTGIGPPQLSDAIRIKTANIFMKTVEAALTLDNMGVNRNYYPYYMSKILKQILPPDSPDLRILFYIHYQGEETITAKDQRWQRICELVPELTYEDTDTTLSHKYSPINYI